MPVLQESPRGRHAAGPRRSVLPVPEGRGRVPAARRGDGGGRGQGAPAVPAAGRGGRGAALRVRRHRQDPVRKVRRARGRPLLLRLLVRRGPVAAAPREPPRESLARPLGRAEGRPGPRRRLQVRRRRGREAGRRGLRHGPPRDEAAGAMGVRAVPLRHAGPREAHGAGELLLVGETFLSLALARASARFLLSHSLPLSLFLFSLFSFDAAAPPSRTNFISRTISFHRSCRTSTSRCPASP